MQKILTHLLLGSLAVLGACASTTQPDPDGQTHWMTRCDDNADCGELSCICGVCTELCTASDACSIGKDAEASCQRSDTVLDTTDCSLSQAAARVCVPLCEAQSDCNGVASDLTCTSDDVCALEDLPIRGGDSSVPDPLDGDASVDERDPPVTDPITPIELACDEDGNLAGEGPFEVVVSGEFDGSLAIAPDGTVFTMGSLEGGGAYNNALRVVDGELDSFGVQLWELQQMIIEGSDLIVARPDITATDLETQESRTLAREGAVLVLGLAADDEAVYWTTHLEEPYRIQLWRSPRVPGASEMLTEVEAYAHEDRLVLLNDRLFFFGSPDTIQSPELFHIAKDGSDGGAITVMQVPSNAYGLLTDGQDLFFALQGARDELDDQDMRTFGTMRIDGVTFEMETLFESGHGPQELIVGGPYLYWITEQELRAGELIATLWRGLSDGRGQPQQLGTLRAFVDPLALHNGELYWIARCRIGTDGTTRAHIVKRTD